MTYYNEHDPKAAAWLRELIKASLIPDGEVDTRDIQEVSPHDLTGYTQQHFFAGIGGWPLALRLAGWPDSRPVRTGSCPCQPFSDAGLGLAEKDPRHLWPWFRDLVTFGEPTTTFGEQVASKAGREWLAGIRADLEGLGYEVGAADLCAASAGAPQIRQRLFWVGYPGSSRYHRSTLAGASRRETSESDRQGSQSTRRVEPQRDGSARRMGGSCGERGRRHPGTVPCEEGASAGERRVTGSIADEPFDASAVGRLARTDGGQRGDGEVQRGGQHGQQPKDGLTSFWNRFGVLFCTDGKARRIEPGTFPLVDGLPGRLGLLRGYGNAIVPQVAVAFIQACEEARNQV